MAQRVQFVYDLSKFATEETHEVLEPVQATTLPALSAFNPLPLRALVNVVTRSLAPECVLNRVLQELYNLVINSPRHEHVRQFLGSDAAFVNALLAAATSKGYHMDVVASSVMLLAQLP